MLKAFAGIRMKFGKGKHIFIKDNITGDVNPTSCNVKILVAFVHVTVAKESTLLGSKLEFMFVVWAKVRPTSTTKDSKR